MHQFSFTTIPPGHVSKLKTDLAEALEAFQNVSERVGACRSLQAMCACLKSLTYFDENGLVASMLPILAGMERLDDGARPTILTPRKGAKQPACTTDAGQSLNPMEKLADALRVAKRAEGRTGGLLAIRACIDYIVSDCALGDNLAHPLRCLVTALEHLDDGVVDPLVAPIRMKGAPPHDTYPDIIKATAIACVDKLKATGDTLPVALRRVADELKAQGYPIGGHLKTSDVKVLQRWREGLSRSKEPSILSNVHAAISAELRDIVYPSPESAWADLKPRLRRVIAEARFRLGPAA